MNAVLEQLRDPKVIFQRIKSGALPRERAIELIELLTEQQRRKARRKILTYFPEVGPLARDKYPKHMEFFKAGVAHRERLMLAANRVGKTEGVGGYEVAVHLTGQYPSWWQGRRFDHPVKVWAAGNTSKKVFEILQFKLLGAVGNWGTGLIPGDSISRIVRASGGIADMVDTVYARHASGSDSQLTFKSYDQRREGFEGTEQDIIWLDEEPPLDIYTECLIRTMTNNGMIICTFTPLLGMSDVVMQFLPEGNLPQGVTEIGGRAIIMATWDDAPHLTEEAKKELWASLPPFQRDARSKGIPQLGAGAIYPVPETDLLVQPFVIPDHWPRGYGMDVGWNWTAGVWGALNRDTDTVYLYHEYKRSQAEPSVHVAGIRAPGEWVPGFIDPASRGRSQRDGEQLLNDYIQLGLKLTVADNGVESGLYSVWNRMSTGRIKVFDTLKHWLNEFRLYRRDEKGRVVKANDHLMDATRYLDSRLGMFAVKPPDRAAVVRQPRPASVWG
jgi:phage terminase large subunit-like protein